MAKLLRMAKQKDTLDNSPCGNGRIINIIAAGTKVIGTLVVESDFRLDGEVEGDIQSKTKVVIGEKGTLKGSLTCANAEILGKVIGDISASHTLTLHSTAEISGDVQVKSLIVEPNAVFNGSCSMKEHFEEMKTENVNKKEAVIKSN